MDRLILVGVIVSVLSERLHSARRRERTRDERTLEERAALLDLASDAVFVRATGTEQLTFWSAGAQRLYGWSSEQALGRVPHELLQTVWPESFAVARRSLERDGHWEGELRHRTADGREIVVLSRQALAPPTNGGPRAVLEINSDLTQRIGLEEQLRQAQKLEAIGQLAGGVAHDFNNQLTVIGGYGTVLSEQLGDGPGAEEISEVLRASERASHLTRQLLAFSRRQVFGPELADRLHEIWPGLPVLFVSGYTGEILRNRARLAEESIVVEKPFDRATLLRSLRTLLDETGHPSART